MNETTKIVADIASLDHGIFHISQVNTSWSGLMCRNIVSQAWIIAEAFSCPFESPQAL
jgi:hypothetical protein